MMAMFSDRIDAGRRLAAALGPREPAGTVIFALPRGGVPVAAEIASATGAPMDLLFVRKIGAPGHEELALGAVVDGEAPDIAINEDVARYYGLGRAEVEAMAKPHLAEIERRRHLYLGGRAPLSARGRTAVVVDDGIATGASMLAALRALKHRHPAAVVLAVPVAPPDTLEQLRPLADEVVCLEVPANFLAVGAHYEAFPQVGDDEVVEIMRRVAERPRGPS
ncbi:phosphoribosyltransferase [Zhengella mangrovi]|uniref:Phosphoribosyltransferase n=1 Tax=Zhengella mangrovi TaxID=1982044 RepID=A0A2G1QN76_9HYPH|nr:phosphoribosyltransferase family protein [Zhengella mangrovi]PHP66973.1 phosphoribosyltransferase [Zhengella mangrovi]